MFVKILIIPDPVSPATYKTEDVVVVLFIVLISPNVSPGVKEDESKLKYHDSWLYVIRGAEEETKELLMFEDNGNGG